MFYLSIALLKWKFFIRSGYRPRNSIIPIGCDCHAAYFIKSMKAKKCALPFDWMNISPLLGLKYVQENIDHNFEYFLHHLVRNKRNLVVSKMYNFAEFTHSPTTIFGAESVNRMNNKVKSFKKLTSSVSCSYLYSVPSASLSTRSDVEMFYETVVSFHKVLKPKDSLHLYIRYDEDFNENRLTCELLLQKLSRLSFVATARFIRPKSKFGIWGDEKKFNTLFRDLRLNSSSKIICGRSRI